jgi:DNA-binding transcriptional MerR regulator
MTDLHRTEQLYTIHQLSHMLNIPKPTLRFWETELEGILVPLRTPGGQRRYTHKHVTVIERIHDLKQQGMSLKDIRTQLNSSEEVDADQTRIELLASKVAELVKIEINRFLQQQGERMK